MIISVKLLKEKDINYRVWGGLMGGGKKSQKVGRKVFVFEGSSLKKFELQFVG